MFCLTAHHESHHHHQHPRILHSFRSHRSLRASAAAAMHHRRDASDASSMARTSTESASTPTSRSEFFVEWDPLRLHPPLAAGPGPILPSPEAGRRAQPHEPRHVRSMHFHNPHHDAHAQAQAQAARALHSHSQSAPSLVIYGGFDFGFSNSSGLKPPSSPSSVDGSSEAVTPNSCRGAFEWNDTPTPRPHPSGEAGADHFIKRGDWKRRGIVFASDSPAASEEECFDLEMEF